MSEETATVKRKTLDRNLKGLLLMTTLKKYRKNCYKEMRIGTK